MIRAYIGMGSNLQDPEYQVRAGAEALSRLPDTTLVAVSALYLSRPMGPADQPDYVNAVAALDTALPPLSLLDALLSIEADHGRTRNGQRWGARTLDLDLLLYGDQVIALPRLTVPHPGINQRAFVLLPLAELAPDLLLPDGHQVVALAADCDRNGIRRLAEA